MAMTSGGVSVCPICHEEITDQTLHFRKCKGADTSIGTNPAIEDPKEVTTPTETVKVTFSWTSSSGFSYQSITLLSAFQQSLELYLHEQGENSSQYLSGLVDVPVGEFDGQLVFSNSYLYPLKKFLIERDGDVIHLELDLTKMDHNDDMRDTADTSTGSYNQYVTAYTTTGGDPDMQYNPAYSGSPTHTNNVGGSKQTRLLMIFTPTSPGSDALYEHGDDMYVNKNSHLQLMPARVYEPDKDDEDLSDPEFSQQLTEEGFTPATVKSKKGTSSSVTIKKKPYATSVSSTTVGSTHTYGHTTPTVTMATGPTTTSSSSRSQERFSVAQIKSETSSHDHITRDEHLRVCEERDRIKRDTDRVKVQLEGQIRRLKKKLGEDDTNEPPEDDVPESVTEELMEVRHELELVNKELLESKDRVTALENQIAEYAGTIEDQSKVIHNYTHHGADKQYMKLYNQLSEHTVKQQTEFRLQIEDFRVKLDSFSQFKDENAVLRETCDKMSADITEYRSQTKQLVKDIEAKKKEVAILRDELQKGGANRGSRVSGMESLEIETLRQKCDGWREMAERTTEEVDVLRIQVQQLEQERDSLNHELQGLSEKLQTVLSERETGQNRRVLELQKQLKELTDIRIRNEEEMVRLRSEKTKLAERNSQLALSCDPEEIGKVKLKLEEALEGKRSLETELSDLREKYELHQQKNIDLKNQLEEAADPQKLISIQDKLSRYRKERDIARQTVIEKEVSHSEEVNKLTEALNKMKLKKVRYQDMCKTYEQVTETLKAEKDELVNMFQSLHGNGMEDVDTSGSDINMSPPHMIQPRPLVNMTSSTQSLPITVESLDMPKQRIKGGHTHSGHAHTGHAHTGTAHLSLVNTARVRQDRPHLQNSAQNIPSLSQNDDISVVQVRTINGLQEAYIVRVDPDVLERDMRVVVLRKKGNYEEGVVKYFGYPVSGCDSFVIGIQLDLKRDDKKANDGTYSDGVRHFACPKGHGLYVSLEKVYIQIQVN